MRRVEPVRMRKPGPDSRSKSPRSPKDPLEIPEKSTERYQLIIWEAWGRREFEKFKSYHDRFDACVE